MAFAAPLLLAGLALLAIPLLIHLFQFRRFKTIYFSNVALLRQVMQQTNSPRRWKHYLVLTSRLLAFLFLVLAFARPYWPGKTENSGERKHYSFYLDNSFSMGNMKDGSRLLDRAVAEIRQLVARAGQDDRFQLLTNDLLGKHMRLLSREDFLQELSLVDLSPAYRSLREITNRQHAVLAAENVQHANVYLFSDFQVRAGLFVPDTAYRYSLIPLPADAVNNVAIDSAWFADPIQLAGRPNRLLVRTIHHGAQPVEGIRLGLQLNGQTKAVAELTLQPGESRTDTLVFPVQQAGWNRAELSIEDYPVVFDDRYYLTFFVPEKINVLRITGNSPQPFIPGVFRDDPAVVLESMSATALNYTSFSQYSLIILEDLQVLSSGLTAALQQYLEGGGNVLVFPAQDADVTAYNNFLQQLGTPGFEKPLSLLREGGTVNLQQPVIRQLIESRPEPVFTPAARFSFPIRTTTAQSGEPVFTFRDGQMALGRFTSGNGNLYLSAVPLHPAASDWSGSSLFAPFLYALSLQGSPAESMSWFLGSSAFLRLPIREMSSDQVYEIRGEGNAWIPEQFRRGNNLMLRPGEYAQKAGFHSIGPKADGEIVVGLNYNREESAMQFFSSEELQEKLPYQQVAVLRNEGSGIASLASLSEAGTPLWKVGILLSLIFFLTEILLLRFWK